MLEIMINEQYKVVLSDLACWELKKLVYSKGVASWRFKGSMRNLEEFMVRIAAQSVASDEKMVEIANAAKLWRTEIDNIKRAIHDACPTEATIQQIVTLQHEVEDLKAITKRQQCKLKKLGNE